MSCSTNFLLRRINRCAPVVFFGILSVCLAAPPKRIAITPTRDSRGVAEGDAITPLVHLFLRERLPECPSVRLVSSSRTSQILSAVRSGARKLADEELLEAFSQHLPVTMILFPRFVDGALELRIYQGKAPKTFTYPNVGVGKRQETVLRLAADLADVLELPPAERPALTEKRIADDTIFSGYYFTSIISVAYPRNPGEFRMEYVVPLFAKHPDSVRLAARVAESAGILVTAGKRDMSYAKIGTQQAALAVPLALGSPWESKTHRLIGASPETFQEDLLAMAGGVVATAVDDELEDIVDEGDDGGIPTADMDLGAVGRAGAAGRAQRLGAVRVLGLIESKPARAMVAKAASHASADVRLAAAEALVLAASGGDQLAALSKDRDPTVALTAAWGLWRQQKEPERAGELMSQFVESKNKVMRQRAADILAAIVIAAPSEPRLTAAEPTLRRLMADADGQLRRLGWQTMLRLRRLSEAEITAALEDTDEAIVTEAARHLPEKPSPELIALLKQLANDPATTVSQGARRALAPHRPTEAAARDDFDLAIDHPYVRMQIVDRLAKEGDAAALARLLQACQNNHPHVRAKALRRLFDKDPAQARPAALRALRDPFHWVRLHAAALAPDCVQPADAPLLKAAMAAEDEAATLLYLGDALAKAEGRPPPTPPTAARSVTDRDGVTWLCPGFNEDAADSPFEAYYSLGGKVNDGWRKAYAAGKIFFTRRTPISNPGLIITDSNWQDRFWLALRGMLPDDELPYIDGVVYGEESMRLSGGGLWKSGWRLFCRDAGLDPDSIDGDQEKLSTPQKRAWGNWSQARCIDGFNMLHDYTKLRFGKLRPGIQVATFLPGESVITPFDHRWKFDVAGIYDYKGCNRIAGHMLVRRIKTVWPKRPVIWLSLGIGGYEMNPVRYTHRGPKAPITNRAHRAYADAVSAWLAGAEPGWFSTWIFVSPTFKGGMMNLSGVQIIAEDIGSNPALIRRGIRHSFRGVHAIYDLAATKQPEIPATAEAVDLDELELDDPNDKPDPLLARIEGEKERLFDGFQFYGRYVYDCARLFSDLPRLEYSAPVLLVRPGISVWTRGSTYPMIPGFGLMSSFDFLCDLNKTARMDLARYRVIAVHRPGLLQDPTMAGITNWLRDTPGLLYVHDTIPHDNAAEASTTVDLDGRLQNDWPWEDAVSIIDPLPPEKKKKRQPKATGIPLEGEAGPLELKAAKITSAFTVKGGEARVLLAYRGQPVLVLWQRPDFKGAVLFDGVSYCSAPYLELLQGVMNKLRRERGIGKPIERPFLQQQLDVAKVTAAATSAYYRGASQAETLTGVDLLTGVVNPSVGPSRRGAIVSEDFTGKFVVAWKGMVAFSDKPFSAIERRDDGLVVTTPGLFRVTTATGGVKATVAGKALPEPEEASKWLLYGDTDGAAPLLIGGKDSDRLALYIRSQTPVTLTAD